MNPWLLHGHLPGIGQVALSGWFTWLAVALTVATVVGVREARWSGESAREALRLAMVLVVAGVAGSRLGHLFTTQRDAYLEEPVRLLMFWEGGMVLYGGLVAASLTALWWCRARGLDFLRLGDALAPALAVGIAIGRLGCFTAGCCYGRPIDWPWGAEWPWGVVFLSGQVPSALRGVSLHPTQLYASANALVLFLVLVALRRRQRFDGQVIGAFLILYGLTRSLLEGFRLDLERGFVLPEVLGELLSTSQAISLPTMLVGGLLIRWGRARSRREQTLGLTPPEAHRARRRRALEEALTSR